MESQPKALLVAQWLRDKKGQDVEVIDVAGVCPIAEAVILVSATSQRHAKGLAAHVLDCAAEENLVITSYSIHYTKLYEVAPPETGATVAPMRSAP